MFICVFEMCFINMSVMNDSVYANTNKQELFNLDVKEYHQINFLHNFIKHMSVTKNETSTSRQKSQLIFFLTSFPYEFLYIFKNVYNYVIHHIYHFKLSKWYLINVHIVFNEIINLL